MNSAIANYLRSPELVAKVQILFGIKLLEYRSDRSSEDQQTNDNLTRRNCKNVRKSEFSESSEADSESAEKKYIVTNKFWYFLFLIGTELGDEVTILKL